MTPLPRLEAVLARRLRGIFRKAIGSRKHPPPVVWFVPGDKGSTLAVLETPDVIVTCQLPLLRLDGPACIPWPKFAKDSGPLELENASTKPLGVPAVPREWSENDAKLLTALDEADGATAKEGSRYLLHRVQVRGKRGEIVATDTKMALIWSGWSFPFGEDVLVARTSVFGMPEFASAKAVKIGRTTTHLVIAVDAWTVFLAIDASGRFPDVQSIVPRLTTARTRLWLDPAEGEVLVTALAKLPGRTDDSSPVTLDLGNQVVLRARGEGDERATVVPLSASRVVGPSQCLTVDRRHLARACRLGCREIEFTTAEKPVAARHGALTLVWMPLPGGGVSASPKDVHTTLAAIAGQPVKSAHCEANAKSLSSSSPVASVSVSAESSPYACNSPQSRPGLFDTLIAGSNWLLSTIRLKSLNRAS